MLQTSLVDSNGNTLMRRTNRKTKPNIQAALKLERVIGFTPSSNTSISTHPTQDTLAFPSGCTTVLFDLKKYSQGPFLVGTLKTASPDLVTNTSATPSISKGHPINSQSNFSKNVNLNSKDSKFIPPKSVVAMIFSPDGKYLAVGEAGRNPRVLIWDLEQKKYISSLKGHKFGVLALAFSPDLKYLVSLGLQHDGIINVWDWKKAVKIASNRVSSKVNGLIFSTCGTYFVTLGLRHVRFWYFNSSLPFEKNVVLDGRSGILGTFNGKNFLDGVFNQSLYTITSDGFLCKINELRKIELSVSLKVKGAISIAYCNGKLAVGCTDGTTRIYSASDLKLIVDLPKPSLKCGLNYPDTIAIKFNYNGTKLINIFSDHSMYILDITHTIEILHSDLFHSDAVWGSDFCPSSNFQHLSTCSSDGTIRFWNLDDQTKNKILCLDQDSDNRYHSTITSTEPNTLKGIRSVKFTNDGLYILSGDRVGNLRIHDIANHKLFTYQEAHDSEILDIDVVSDETGYYVATGSRDRIAHVFKMSPGKFNLVQTLDEHSSSITAIRFFDHANHFISCSADKSIIFRNNMDPIGLSTGKPHYTSSFNYCNRATFSAMAVDELNGTIIAVSQDKQIHKLCARTGKLLKLIRIMDPNTDVSMTRVALDSSGQYACVAGTDKGIRIVDLSSGQLLGSVYGHSEMVTSVKFSPDCSRVISTSGDGCIFIWKLNIDLIAKINNLKLKQSQQISYSTPKNFSSSSKTRTYVNQGTSNSNISTGLDNIGARRRTKSLFPTYKNNSKLVSRWGRKIEKNGISIIGSSLASRSQIELNEFQSKLIKNHSKNYSSESTDSCYDSSVLEDIESKFSSTESIYSFFSVNLIDAGYESTESKKSTDSVTLNLDKHTKKLDSNYQDPLSDNLNNKYPDQIISVSNSLVSKNSRYQALELKTMENQLHLANLLFKDLNQSFLNLNLNQLTDSDPPQKHNLLANFLNLSNQLIIPDTTSISNLASPNLVSNLTNHSRSNLKKNDDAYL